MGSWNPPAGSSGLDAPGSSQAGVAALNTSRTPSATRPVFVVASVSVECEASGGEFGKVFLRIEAADPPTVTVGDVGIDLAVEVTHISVPRLTLCGFVPAGHTYRLVTEATQGTPVFALLTCREWVL